MIHRRRRPHAALTAATLAVLVAGCGPTATDDAADDGSTPTADTSASEDAGPSSESEPPRSSESEPPRSSPSTSPTASAGDDASAADGTPVVRVVGVDETPAGNVVDAQTLEGDGAAGQRIADAVDDLVDRILRDYDARVEDSDTPEGTPEPELELTVEVPRAGEQVVSVVVETYRYLGGASGFTSVRTAVFRSDTGAELTLSEVGVEQDERQVLAEALVSELEQRDAQAFADARSVLLGDLSLLRQWSLTDDAFVLYADAATLAPAAAGVVRAELPLDEVTELTGFELP